MSPSSINAPTFTFLQMKILELAKITSFEKAKVASSILDVVNYDQAVLMLDCVINDRFFICEKWQELSEAELVKFYNENRGQIDYDFQPHHLRRSQSHFDTIADVENLVNNDFFRNEYDDGEFDDEDVDENFRAMFAKSLILAVYREFLKMLGLIFVDTFSEKCGNREMKTEFLKQNFQLK